MSTTPPPWSGRPPRLTERERRALHEIEVALAASDPRLGARLARTRPASSRPQTSTDHAVQAVVLVVLCVILLPGAWATTVITLAGLAAMGVLAVRTFVQTRDADGGAAGG